MLRRVFSTVYLLALFGSLPVAARAQAPTRDPEVVKQQFNEVAARLDTGGDLFLVANVDGLVEQFVKTLASLAALAPAVDTNAQQAADIVGKIDGLLRKNGVYAVRAAGMSTVPRPDGLHDVKMFLSRDAAAATLPFWRGVAGLKNERPASLDYLPAGTVMASGGTGDMKQWWAIMKQAVEQMAPPEALAGFNEFCQAGTTNPATSPDALIASLRSESFFSLQFSETETLSLPTGQPGGVVTFPAPSVLTGLAVQNDTIEKTILKQYPDSRPPIARETVGETVVYTLPVFLPLPVPLQPSFATSGGMFLFGTTKRVVTESLQAAASKNGLAQTESFRKAFEGLPLDQCCSFSYMNRRFGEVLADVQTRLFTMRPGADPRVSGILQELMQGQGVPQAATVTQNWKSGIAVKGVSSSGGRQMITAWTAAPIGLMAGIAVPSFVKARSTARQNACINNLRQLDSAKEQWAMEHGKQEGDTVNVEDVLPYLKGGRMPVCPAGGTYTLHPIGQPPACSAPGHTLPE